MYLLDGLGCQGGRRWRRLVAAGAPVALVPPVRELAHHLGGFGRSSSRTRRWHQACRSFDENRCGAGFVATPHDLRVSAARASRSSHHRPVEVLSARPGTASASLLAAALPLGSRATPQPGDVLLASFRCGRHRQHFSRAVCGDVDEAGWRLTYRFEPGYRAGWFVGQRGAKFDSGAEFEAALRRRTTVTGTAMASARAATATTSVRSRPK